MPVQIRQFLIQQCRCFCLEIGFCFSERSVHPAAFVDPLSLLQVVKSRLPAFWDTENEESDVLVRCVKRSHRSFCFALAPDPHLTENICTE